MVGEFRDAAPSGPPGLIGPYLVQRELGRGGMGVVYQAHDPRMNRPVAIKKIQGQPDPAAWERFRREAQLAGKLRHPGIAQVYEVVVAGPDAPYLVQELVPGTPLIDVTRNQRLNGRRAAGIVAQLCDALGTAHAQGVLHRDLKPQNVMLRDGDAPVLLDFGLAKDLGGQDLSLTEEGAMLGTVAYAAPEQLEEARDADERADVYGLGAILYQCLSGAAPFSGASKVNVLAAVLTKDPPPLTEVHRDLATICLKCLEKDPDHRYPTAAALGADLQRFLDGEPIEARPVPGWVRLARRAWRRKGLLLVGALLLAAGVGGVLYGVYGAAGEARRRESAEEARRKVERAAELLQRLEEVQRYRYQPLRSDPAEEEELVAGARAELQAILTQLDALTATAPRPAQVFLHQGWARLALFDLAGAEAAADAALERDPQLSRAHLLLGRALTLRGLIASFSESSTVEERQVIARRAAAAFERGAQGARLTPLEATWLALAQQDHAAAAQAAERIPKHHPAEERAILEALSRMPVGRFLSGPEQRRAQVCLNTALATCPRSLEARVLRALLGFRTGATQTVLLDLTHALRIKPGDPLFLRCRAEAFYAQERDADALDDLERLLEARPDDGYALALRALVHTRRQDARAAAADLKRALELAPSLPRVKMYESYVLRVQGKFDAALRAVDAAAALGASSFQVAVGRSDVHRAAGDLGRAILELTRAIEQEPDAGVLYARRGLYQLSRGSLKAAEQDYQRALALGSAQVTDLKNLAAIRAERGDVPGALRALDHGLQLQPRSPLLLNARADLRLRNGDRAGARADFDASIAIAPSADTHFARSQLRRLADDAGGALADLDAALALDPKHTLARVNRGILRMQAKRFVEARADYDAALAADPKCGEAYTYRGVLRMQRQDLTGALRDMNQAEQLGARSRALYFARGEVHRLQGRAKEAALDWERGLGHEDPNMPAPPNIRRYIQAILGRPSKH